jgi:hypothetical protein
MFDKTSHDFGVVARGAKVEKVFTVENIYEEDAKIDSVRSSCSCTKPSIDKGDLKTWEKTQIKATIDTRGFTGRKDATLTVTFSKPFRAEVQLQCYCFIRSDVVVEPGAISFGRVNHGTAAQQTVKVHYAGVADWRIERVECSSAHLSAVAVQRSRGLKDGVNTDVVYDVTCTLSQTAPVGYIEDHVVLVTNDSASGVTRVPVRVEAIVVPQIAIRPDPLYLGDVEPGKSTERNLVVQSQAPIRIKAIRCLDTRFSAKLASKSDKLHVIPIAFLANGEPGPVAAKLLLDLESPDAKPLEAAVTVKIVPPRPPSEPPGESK